MNIILETPYDIGEDGLWYPSRVDLTTAEYKLEIAALDQAPHEQHPMSDTHLQESSVEVARKVLKGLSRDKIDEAELRRQRVICGKNKL